MANICDSTFKLCSCSSEPVQKIYNVLQKLDDKKRWNIGLADLADELGIDYEARNISVRGSIYFFELDDEVNVLTISTESAWTPTVELFDAFAEQFGEDEVSVSYMAVEVGCEVFQIRDCGDFFNYDCLVSYSGEPFGDGVEEPFESVYDAIQFWCQQMHIDRAGRSDEEMRSFIEAYDYGDDSDTFFYIYDFDKE